MAQRQGFELLLRFVGGEASQWQPNLFRNRRHLSFLAIPAGTWRRPWPTSHPAHQAAQGKSHLKKPFFVYTSQAQLMRPHHPTPEGSRRSAICTCSMKAGHTVPRERSCQTEAPGHHARERQADDVAERAAEWDSLGLLGRSSSSSKPMFMALNLAYPTTEIGRVIQAVEDLES